MQHPVLVFKIIAYNVGPMSSQQVYSCFTSTICFTTGVLKTLNLNHTRSDGIELSPGSAHGYQSSKYIKLELYFGGGRGEEERVAGQEALKGRAVPERVIEYGEPFLCRKFVQL